MQMTNDNLLQRAKALKLVGLISHWEEVRDNSWVADLLSWEESERSHCSLANRLKSSRLGRFKPLADFDWNWPKKIDRQAIEEFMSLSFIMKRSILFSAGLMALVNQ